MDMNNFYKDKNILVTGGAGFVGSHICEELVSLGSNVYCLDDLSAGKEANVSFLESYDNFHFIKKDVCDDDAEMNEIFHKTDIVFHNAASKKNICLENPHRDLDVNAAGTLNLLQLSIKHNVSKFVHASTGSVYGEPSIFPTKEDHPLKPVSYYGVSKLAGERYVDVFNNLYGLDTTILRYFHVYGPRQESNEFGGVVSIFLRRIVEGKNPIVFGHGRQVRSFTWVKDLVKINLLSASSKISNGKVYNAASGIQITINELAENMLNLLDASSSLRIEYGEPLIGDIMNFDIENNAVKNDLKIEFNTDFWGTLKIAFSDTNKFLGK